MPNYLFHLHECGEITPADEGIERADLAAARQAAIEGARDIMRSELEDGRLCLSCHIEIEDEAGTLLSVVTFKEAVRVTGL